MQHQVEKLTKINQPALLTGRVRRIHPVHRTGRNHTRRLRVNTKDRIAYAGPQAGTERVAMAKYAMCLLRWGNPRALLYSDVPLRRRQEPLTFITYAPPVRMVIF